MRNFFLSALFVLFAGYSTQANLLTNGSFEAGSETNIPEWTLTDADHIAVTPSARYSGSNAIVMKGWTSGGRIYQEIPAFGISNYTFSADGMWSEDCSSNSVVQMSIEFFSIDRMQLQTSSMNIRCETTWTRKATKWSTYAMAAAAPTNTAMVRVVLSFNGLSGAVGCFYWDNLQLSSESFATPTYYVCLSNSFYGPVFPYTSWTTAATNLQEVLDVAMEGGVIRMYGGVYAITSSIQITKAVTLVGQFGSAYSIIDGQGLARCFDLQNSNAVLAGLTITGGYADKGAGVLCQGATVRKCVITGNRAFGDGGGGVFLTEGSVLESCQIVSNVSAFRGGGVLSEPGNIITNCRIANNVAAQDGGGIYWSGVSVTNAEGLIKNCRITGNIASNDGGGVYLSGTVWLDLCVLASNEVGHCGGGAFAHLSWIRNCLFYENASDGPGGGVHLTSGGLESCTIAGNRADLYGGLSVGSNALVLNCIVYDNTAATASPNWGETESETNLASFSHTCSAPLMPGVGNIDANPLLRSIADYVPAWNSPCMNAGLDQAWMPHAVDLRGVSRLQGHRVDMGAYESGPIHYVSLDGSNEAPFTTWATAATTIQAAVDVAEAWEIVVVTDGVYQAGARVSPGVQFYHTYYWPGYVTYPHTQTNRVVIDRAVSVQSVNGPEKTSIAGDSSTRCVYLCAGSELIGFTLSQGHAGVPSTGGFDHDNHGGGALLNYGGLLSDCFIVSNQAYAYGGGVACYGGGCVDRCVVKANLAHDGGNVFCDGGIVRNCLVVEGSSSCGGGIYMKTGSVLDCTITNNHASYGGGIESRSGLVARCKIVNNRADSGGNASIYNGVLRDCLLTKGEGGRYAGGLMCRNVDVQNCTISDNRSQWETAAGIDCDNYNGVVRIQNCIINNNFYGTNNNNLTERNWSQSSTNFEWSSSCTTPNPGGSGNITNAPLFMDPAR
ncbi:MAG TPA: hypothetical protein DCZ95_01905, partial [Verrucomicrobia bacterium]|nr:hypothetical protein [Verrucomicrobiota bacterium]